MQVGAAAGGGLMLSLSLPFANREARAAGEDGFAPNAFIRIRKDGQVVLVMPYVEMGQGTYTSIPMLIAEELGVDLDQVRVEHAPPNEKLYGNHVLGLEATGLDLDTRGVASAARSGRGREDHARVGGGAALECRGRFLPRAAGRSSPPADRETD
jgi:isoquinoline 1-oxidoreductase beta subunit